LYLLSEDLDVDTSYLSPTQIFDYLIVIDYDNYVLDLHALETFFDEFGIDYESFNAKRYAAVQEELGIVYIPYDVNLIIDILESVTSNTTTIDQPALQEYLIAVN
jgi:hypothetical protein